MKVEFHPRAVSFFHPFWWNYHHFARAEEKCFIGRWESSSDRWDVDGGKIANKNETCKSFAPNPSASTVPSGTRTKNKWNHNLRRRKGKKSARPTSSSPVIPECNKNCINLYNNKGSRKAKAKKPQPKHTKHHNITNSSISWGKRQQYNKNRREKEKHENKIIHLIISTKALSAFLCHPSLCRCTAISRRPTLAPHRPAPHSAEQKRIGFVMLNIAKRRGGGGIRFGEAQNVCITLTVYTENIAASARK